MFPHAQVVADSAAEKDVVPPANIVGRDTDVSMVIFDTPLFPVVVVGRVGEPVKIVVGHAIRQVGQVLERQVGKRGVHGIDDAEEGLLLLLGKIETS